MSLPHKSLTTRGYILHKDKISPAEKQKVLKDLTVKTTVIPAFQDFMKPKVYPIYFHSSKYFYLPRYYAEKEFGPPSVNLLAKGQSIKAICHTSPRSHQLASAKVLDKTFDKKAYPEGNGGVMCLPCGWGKTYLAIRTACRLGLKTLVIVNKEPLMDQWRESIEQFTNAKVGIIQQKRLEIEGADIILGMLHTICLNDKLTDDTFKSIGLLVMDEVHHLSSEVFSRALLKVRPRFTLGLSATPERRDGLSHVFYKFIGPLLHREKRTGTNRVVIKQFKLDGTGLNEYKLLYMKNGKTKNTTGMTTALTQCDERNKLIYHILKELARQGRTTLVLSSRRSHLTELREMLEAKPVKMPNGKNATHGFYYGAQGGNKKIHRDMLQQSAKCDIILGTDAIAKEGLDIPSLNSLVFAAPPGTDVEQAVGRILRKFHEQYFPMVIDLVDKTGNFLRHATERNRWYKDEDYQLQNCQIKLNDVHALTDTSKFLIKRDGRISLKLNSPIPKKAIEPSFDNLMIIDSNEKVSAVKKRLRPKTIKDAKEVLYGKPPEIKDPFLNDCLLVDEPPIRAQPHCQPPPSPASRVAYYKAPKRRLKINSRLKFLVSWEK